MHCSTKATDVSHEADGEALCPDVCELLQLAMLKDFLFKAIKLLSAQILQRGCSVLSALLCSCCSVLPTLLCSCCSVLSTLLCSCCSVCCSCVLLCVLQLPLFAVCPALQLPCLVCAAQQPEQQLQQQQQQQHHVQQQLAWPHTKLSDVLAAQLCAWIIWLHVQLGTLMLVTAAAGQLYCWGCQHWQSLSQSFWPISKTTCPARPAKQSSSCNGQDHLEMQDSISPHNAYLKILKVSSSVKLLVRPVLRGG